MRIKRFFASLFLLAIILTSLTGSVKAQAVRSYFEPETGHWIVDPVLGVIETIPNRPTNLGYAITDLFADPLTGQQVQFFQKGRINLVPTSTGIRVQLTPLGEMMYVPGKISPIYNPRDPSCRAFATGYSICYEFLAYYELNSGEQIFGLPISPLEEHDGRLVQYFQAARMEYWFDRPAGSRVVLSDLGRMYFDMMQYNPMLLKANPKDAIGQRTLLQPTTAAFSAHSLIGAGEQQTIQVVVLDSYLAPVEGAVITLTLELGGGLELFYPAGTTNADGICSLTVNAPNLAPATLVPVRVRAITPQGIESTTRTSFRIWW
jgi:hypothetical protein